MAGDTLKSKKPSFFQQPMCVFTAQFMFCFSASFSVFKPSSYYLVAQTSFGLQLQIQLFPVMQLFVTVDQSVQGKLQGKCLFKWEEKPCCSIAKESCILYKSNNLCYLLIQDEETKSRNQNIGRELAQAN